MKHLLMSRQQNRVVTDACTETFISGYMYAKSNEKNKYSKSCTFHQSVAFVSFNEINDGTSQQHGTSSEKTCMQMVK